MAQVLSNENQLLLKTILDRKPESLKELEVATGRSSSNLSRTLKTMAASSRREHDAGAVRI
jgi:predicted transcriptional regulator